MKVGKWGVCGDESEKGRERYQSRPPERGEVGLKAPNMAGELDRRDVVVVPCWGSSTLAS